MPANSICPICKRSDSTANIEEFMATQVIKMPGGYAITPQVEFLLYAIDEEPSRLNFSAHKKWERAVNRRKRSYICFECVVIFLTENGKQSYSSLDNIRQFLYSM